MKYRKKPVEVEACQYTGDVYTTKCTRDFNKAYQDGIFREEDGKLLIETLEGTMTASKGDYIIKGINGEFYPCKPDVFEKTYEPVNEEVKFKDLENKTFKDLENEKFK